jgi:uncharacterized linocin/CFP29 family protein
MVRQVPSDTVEIKPNAPLAVIETGFTPLNEIWVDFTLTNPQVIAEESQMTAVTLATRATNILSQFFDLLIFQGDKAKSHKLFTDKMVSMRDQSLAVTGLLSASQVVDVKPANTKKPGEWGENTFTKVAEGYTKLQGAGHYGPYALVLPPEPYADTFRSFPKTLIYPAERIKPLVTAGYHGTGTLPDREGLLMSLGGNSMDLVVGIGETAAYVEPEAAEGGRFRFRIYQRFALRLKDPTAIIKLNFK